MTQVELAAFQVSRQSLPWLLAAIVAALLPHLSHMPWWLITVALSCLAWRWLVHRGRASYPAQQLRSLMAVALLACVFMQYRTLAGHQAGTGLLIAMFSLKLLEMYRERDAYVVIVLGYFVAATAFLFHFTMWMAFYVGGVCLLFTAALVAVNGSPGQPRLEPLRRAAVMLLQSIPVALLLFVVMPRIGPLWSIGLKPATSQTGVSDRMTPGDIGKLIRSGELAFRAEFEGPPPPAKALYWRGLTLEAFDGRTWAQIGDIERVPSLTWYRGRNIPSWANALLAARDRVPDAQRWQYTVVIEPTQQPWLFALAVPYTQEQRIGLVYDQRLRMREPVKVITRYAVTSIAQPRDVEAPEWLLAQDLRLPAGRNPRARAWALQQRAESASSEEYIRRVLELFAGNGFVYTLEPPRLGGEAVDEFLFDTRRGFCEHYASAFAVLMRAAGIPARVVAGYQGGTVNPLGRHVVVRQSEAHAWAEAWLPGRGWVEYDPTAAVAPARVSEGLRAAIGNEASLLDGSPFGAFDGGGVLAAVGEAVDFLNYNWNKWVLGYNDAAQEGLLTRWLGKFSPLRVALFVAGFGVLVIGVITFWIFREELFRREDPVLREYRRFCAAWAARGHPLAEGEAPLHFAARLCAAEPRRAGQINAFSALFVAMAYGGRAGDPEALRRLRAARVAAA